MAIFKVYRLRFKSPLHISDMREDTSISLKTIHSDTLHAALISCLAQRGIPIPEEGDLGCVISDLFPYYQQGENDTPTYFLPMPLQSTLPQLTDPANAKKMKKVQWVDASRYSRLLHGKKLLEEEKDIDLIQASYLTEKILPEDASGSKDFVKSEVMQRVSIKDRTGKSDAIPYYVDRISFKDHSGLYFLVSGNTFLLDKALQILEMEGIGTDRHVGYGSFKIIKEEQEMIIDTPSAANHQVALSMFIPESEEQLIKLLGNDDNVAYDFIRLGGWITTYPHNTFRKNAIYGFLPGSVFRGTGENNIGKIVNLQPYKDGKPITQYPIWRNGKAIMLPIKIDKSV